MRGFTWLVALGALLVVTGGCELIVDFDRDRITDAGTEVDSHVPDMDGGGEEDAGMDAAAEDGAVEDGAVEDGAVEDGSVGDAGSDAGPSDAGTDAGPSAECGNGTMETGEACDDGNTTTETECPYGTASCTLCNADCSSELSLTGNVCGDGDVASGDEACDDGNTTTETECPYGTASCTLCNADCSSELSLTGNVCGDGVVASGDETCDDGNTMACGTCSADCSTAITPAPATGTITAAAKADLTDGHTFTISDGVDSVTFELDVAGDGVSGGVAVDVSGDTTAADVASTIVAAVTSASALDVTAAISSGDSTVVDLTNAADGVMGNVTITSTVTATGWATTGMDGGMAYDCATSTGCTADAVCSARTCTSDACD